MIPLNKPKIDSLRIRIPLKKVSVNKNHQEFLRTITTVNNDGQILDEHIKTTYFNKNEIISASYAVKNHFGIEEFVYIGFSSKLLKTQYFNGINKDNINLCLDFINSEGLLKITKEQILSAECVDVDFCIDYSIDSEDGTVKDVVTVCNDLTRPLKQINAIPFTRNDNTGIQWGHRDKVGKSYKKKQFLKYYAKAIELKNHSVDFYETYLKDILNETIVDINGDVIAKGNSFFNDDKLMRVETTIKNKAHFKSYGYNVATLEQLLNLDLDTKFLEVFSRPMLYYMTGYREVIHNKKMTLSQRFKYEYCREVALRNRISIESAVPMIALKFQDGITPKIKRARNDLKKTLLEIINMAEVVERTHLHNTKMWNEFIQEIQSKNLIP